MINLKHLDYIKKQAIASVSFCQNPNLTSKQVNYMIRQNIIFTKLGLSLAIEAYQKYTTNKSPIIDEIIALYEDLIVFEKTL